MNNIEDLPEVIVGVIKSYIPPTTLVWLNKENYVKYNNEIKSMIHPSRFEDYIRDMVRSDNIFVLRHIILENIHRWIKMKRWRYKNIIYVFNIIYFKKMIFLYFFDNFFLYFLVF